MAGVKTIVISVFLTLAVIWGLKYANRRFGGIPVLGALLEGSVGA
jgi:hypothetical protein